VTATDQARQAGLGHGSQGNSEEITVSGSTGYEKVWELDGRAGDQALDSQSLLEEILDTVWRAEANWAFDDRLDLLTGNARK
jgi:hypothetical protein